MKFLPLILATVVALSAYVGAVARAVEAAAEAPAAPEVRW